MNIFSRVKAAVSGNINKFSGRKDFLEAVCAASALIAAADGDIEDEEVAATIKAVSSNAALSGAFPAREIEQTADRMFERAKGGRVGRMGLYKEIEDIASDKEAAETVFLVALDVADSDGEVEPAEKQVIGKIAAKLGLDPSKYDV